MPSDGPAPDDRPPPARPGTERNADRLVAACPSASPFGTLGRLGALEVRLAETAREVEKAQRLRFRVFADERGAALTGPAAALGRDADRFDPACDHLVVLDHDVPSKRFSRPRPKVVGTCRLLRGAAAAAAGTGFYAAGEFDIAPLLARHPARSFVELGRFCVARAYRDRRTTELLWAGIWAYMRRHGGDVMIGCASLEGTDPDRLVLPLSFLHHFAPTSDAWPVAPRPGLHRPTALLARDAVDRAAALASLPPLVKAYWRIGAAFGPGAVVDEAFGTTDVFVVLPIERISPRYLAYFGPEASRYVA